MIRTAHPRRTVPLWARLVLLLCVVVGVGAMHTLGHLHSDHESGASAQAAMAPAQAPPAGGEGSADSGALGETGGSGEPSGAAGHMSMAAAPEATDPGGATQATTPGEADSGPAQGTSPDHAGSGAPMLDPTSVCLALGGLALAVLWVVTGAFRHWPGRTALARALPRLRAAIESGPPPRPPSLSALQVLRV
ncbi:hypothetical protein ACFOVU_03765 [Nocardiopsis sediminis]|uniref:Uncharacterized protein n=1 Tax=Nocardiopsis sediminis TaxID=1778267 RepID=A0ABV8FFT7_9ACTN